MVMTMWVVVLVMDMTSHGVKQHVMTSSHR